ncbi:MAG TPA: 6-phosphogluconolactonase [Solirubrobacteraceae bacterium]|jgi:6-phosphogluconolactonase
MRLTTVSDPEAAAARAAEAVARLAAEAIDARGVFHVALAGGSTPKRCHEGLAEQDVDWSRVHIWESDERCVPPDDPESNFRMIRESLLDSIVIPDENVHRAMGERGPEAAADAYEGELRAVVEPRTQADVPVLDVVMCGLGEDGHTMSLFPGHPEVTVKDRLVVGVHDAPKPPPERVSFTLDLVHAARRTILLTAGASKAEALTAVLDGPDPHVPASLLRFGRLEVIADDAAAPSRLRKR